MRSGSSSEEKPSPLAASVSASPLIAIFLIEHAAVTEVARASVSRPVIDRCMQCVILLRQGPERHLGRAIAGPTLEAIALLARTSVASEPPGRSAPSPAARGSASRKSEGRSPASSTPCRRPATRPHTLRADAAHPLCANPSDGGVLRPVGALRVVAGDQVGDHAPRPLGVYAIEWAPTAERDDVLGRLGGVFHGTVMEYLPGRELFIADAWWVPPDDEPIGPMALEVSCMLEGASCRLRVRQSGFDDSPRWRRTRRHRPRVAIVAGIAQGASGALIRRT